MTRSGAPECDACWVQATCGVVPSDTPSHAAWADGGPEVPDGDVEASDVAHPATTSTRVHPMTRRWGPALPVIKLRSLPGIPTRARRIGHPPHMADHPT